MDYWRPSIVEDGVATVQIAMHVSLNDENATTGWFQSFESNTPWVTSETVWTTYPGESVERIDGAGWTKQKDIPKGDIYMTDPQYSVYWSDEPTTIFHDMPMRFFIGGETSPTFDVQTSFIIDNIKSFSVGWRFSVDSKNSGTFYAPKILKNNTEFHDKCIQKLKPLKE